MRNKILYNIFLILTILLTCCSKPHTTPTTPATPVTPSGPHPAVYSINLNSGGYNAQLLITGDNFSID